MAEPITLSAVQADLAELRDAIKKDESWKQTFQDSLDKSTASFREAFDRNKELITQISLSLESEKENRGNADKELGETIKNLSKDVNKVSSSVGKLIWTTGFITTVVTGLLILKFANII